MVAEHVRIELNIVVLGARHASKLKKMIEGQITSVPRTITDTNLDPNFPERDFDHGEG